jgi:hypothetical protein
MPPHSHTPAQRVLFRLGARADLREKPYFRIILGSYLLFQQVSSSTIG